MTEQLDLNSYALKSQPVKFTNGWTHSDMIFVEHGIAYGVNDNGRTICLGEMPLVELYLRSGISDGLKEKQIEVLDIIKKMEDEIGRTESVNTVETKLRTPDVKQRNNQRVRLSRNARNNAKHIKPAKASTKLSLYPVGS